MIKKISVLLMLSMFAISFSQTSLNNYKYVVVPIQFEFLKGQDQYRTSSLTKYLFNELGIKTFFDVQELPEDLVQDRCKALYANVNKLKGGLFRTDIQIELKDCRGNSIVLSEVGSTREKLFKEAYNIAIREAFESFSFLGYSYEPLEEENDGAVLKSENAVITETSTKAEIETLKKEIEKLKQEKEETIKPEPKVGPKKEMVQKEEMVTSPSENSNLLYAQKIEGGFQLVDAEPKKVMVLLNTAAPNVFTVKGKDAIVFQKEGQWIYSENTGTTKTEKVLNIKF